MSDTNIPGVKPPEKLKPEEIRDVRQQYEAMANAVNRLQGFVQNRLNGVVFLSGGIIGAHSFIFAFAREYTWTTPPWWANIGLSVFAAAFCFWTATSVWLAVKRMQAENEKFNKRRADFEFLKFLPPHEDGTIKKWGAHAVAAFPVIVGVFWLATVAIITSPPAKRNVEPDTGASFESSDNQGKLNELGKRTAELDLKLAILEAKQSTTNITLSDDTMTKLQANVVVPIVKGSVDFGAKIDKLNLDFSNRSQNNHTDSKSDSPKVDFDPVVKSLDNIASKIEAVKPGEVTVKSEVTVKLEEKAKPPAKNHKRKRKPCNCSSAELTPNYMQH